LNRLRAGDESDDLRPILDKYCVQDRKREAKMVSLDFELDTDRDVHKQIYTAIAREGKHGEFELKVVQYKPKDTIIGPERHDIVLPGRYVEYYYYVRIPI
jgi:hypothetical protein